jgi:hypothetical protein
VGGAILCLAVHWWDGTTVGSIVGFRAERLRGTRLSSVAVGRAARARPTMGAESKCDGHPTRSSPPKKCVPVAGRTDCLARRGPSDSPPGAPRARLGGGAAIVVIWLLGRGGGWWEAARAVPALLERAALREMRASTRATRGGHEGAALPLPIHALAWQSM